MADGQATAPTFLFGAVGTADPITGRLFKGVDFWPFWQPLACAALSLLALALMAWIALWWRQREARVAAARPDSVTIPLKTRWDS